MALICYAGDVPNNHQLIIIGSGPAGLTAAIYAARAQLEPLVITGQEPGGQLMTTTSVDNWPGALEGVMGPQLMQEMMQQAEKYGAQLVLEDATKVDLATKPFVVTTKSGQTHTAETVIIATGASARTLGVKGEKELWAKGVHTCATCDGFFYKGKAVAVIGGGDAAMEEALFLTKFATKVTIIHRREELRASPIMIKRAQENPKIAWLLNSEIRAYNGTERLESLTVFNNKEQKEAEFKVDGAFLAIGHEPNTKIFKEFITTDQTGYIEAKNAPLTNIEGVFVAGDVNDFKYRQAITAAGAGCKAALEAQWYLRNNK